MSKTIEYVPVRQSGGVGRRLIGLCLALGLIFVAIGYAVADPIHGSFAGLWIVSGYLVGGIGVAGALLRFLFTGRLW